MRHLIAAAAAAGALVLTACGSPSVGDGSTPVPPSQSIAAVASPPEAVTDAPKPVHVEIPKLGVTEDIVPVGLDAERRMVIPPVTSTGWFERGVAPGEAGPAVLAGHVDYEGVKGAFNRIGELAAGDTITVTDEAGTARTFTVYDVIRAPKAQFPFDATWGDTEGPELRLVTCSGAVVDRAYTDNTVVRAREAS